MLSKLFFPEIFPLWGLLLLSFLQCFPKTDFPQKRKIVMKLQSVLPFGIAAVLPGKSRRSSASRPRSPAPWKEATGRHGLLAPTRVPGVQTQWQSSLLEQRYFLSFGRKCWLQIFSLLIIFHADFFPPPSHFKYTFVCVCVHIHMHVLSCLWCQRHQWTHSKH